jgi:hypothetical protein
VLILFYRRRFRELGYIRNLHKSCAVCVCSKVGCGFYYSLDLSLKNLAKLKATEGSVNGTILYLFTQGRREGKER